MQLSWQKVKLQLKETFSISYGSYSHREALIVSLSYKKETGYGECTAIDYYGINLDDFIVKLTSSKALIENLEVAYPYSFYEFISKLNLPTFLLSALDCAYWDLYGKLENKSFTELNGIQLETVPQSSITISIDSIEKQIKKIENSNWNKFKVKCNGLNIEAVYKLTELNKNIALDSNASFTLEDCIWLQNNQIASRFTYLEQPMPIGKFNVLKRDSFANWMADEDCQDQDNLLSLQPHYNSVNIKLVKCGGLTPALQLIKTARQMNFKIMIGCMTETTIGISAGAVLAPLVDYADLDGANLISNDIANGSKIVNGKIIISEHAGLGISIK